MLFKYQHCQHARRTSIRGRQLLFLKLQRYLQEELLLKQERKRQAGASLAFAYGTYNADGYVCVRPDSGRRVSTSDLRYFNDWCKTTFGHGSTHSLRHTHATMLLEAGESLEAVSKRLGHSSIVTTSKYYSNITEKGNSQMKNTLDNLFPAKCE